jgi:hypothetical protein
MSNIKVQAAAVIDARPQEIYAVLSDYREGHPAIVPKPYFKELVVEKGGQGAGTVIRFTMKVMGKEFAYHQLVSEPEPGRVLRESEIDKDLVTTFTLDPLNGGLQTRLTIATNFKASSGLTGLIERLFNPPVMRSIYKKELRQIADYVYRKNLAAA